MSDDSTHEQLALLRSAVRRPQLPDAQTLAPEHPIARVAVDVALAHLDRPFEYLVPETMHESAVPGSRVVVRFAGKQTNGFILSRHAEPEHDGRLDRIIRSVSAEVVLRPDVVTLLRSIADRYAGTFADVVRLAVPPRHARTERRAARDPAPAVPKPDDPGPWRCYDGGPAWLDALAAGESPRGCWAALPGPADALALSVAATLSSGRGAIVCVPDTDAVARISAALTRVIGSGQHVELTADVGAAARYSAFLSLSRGEVRAVVGTRACAFAPVHDLGLVAIWDDADDHHAEPRAPYPHAREVLLTRAYDRDCAVLVGAHGRSTEAQRLIESGWCEELAPARDVRRTQWARVAISGADERLAARDPASGHGRLTHEAFTVMRAGLDAGPVLVQVPRHGYRQALACVSCRSPARCRHCDGPLAQRGGSEHADCRWCARQANDWVCPECAATGFRAIVVGDQRTAEELGRAFPQTPIITSSGSHVRTEVSAEPALVVATPGAEPIAPVGYAAALLLDCALMLSRPDLRVAEESLRRWMNAVALVRSADAGGRVLAMGDPGLEVLQALVRLDPGGYARYELAQRQEAHLPPTAWLAAVEGAASDLTPLLDHDWPQPVELLGPVELDDDRARLIVRTPRRNGAAMAKALRTLQANRTAHKQPHLRVDVDPIALH